MAAPPPPPPLPTIQVPSTSSTNPKPRIITISPTPPQENAVLLSLLTYNGQPFMDHWECFLSTGTPSLSHPSRGVSLSPSGNVRTGFWLEVARGRDIASQNPPDRIVPLQWIPSEMFGSEWDEGIKNGTGELKGDLDKKPQLFGKFEEMLGCVELPKKSLRDHTASENVGKTRITQRNCQTWIVESAEELMRQGVLDDKVVEYFKAMRQ
ncbi:hypothetical protein QBC38DRAFT_484959 [Podospora fimiseda]|uniref:Uncharacterized protein n=1 Tax=Podospora fimiseda TaxID=252190 RepID=A0AAN7BK03_9PEZI|nr:hypothetical protein QBC38DRAFT_484959 [Podospora fimiseda]